MKYGLYVETTGNFADAGLLANLAEEAEEAGWDGFMIWDVIHMRGAPLVDPWVPLALIADRTERMRIGPMVTPIARRRPATLARQTVAIDQLSNGRLTLGVGLGGDPATEFAAVGEDPDPVGRAALLDEGLEVLEQLWTGSRVSFSGTHFQIRDAQFQPPSVQSPRIPIWVGAIWPNKAPVRRAARWDGLAPIHPHFNEGGYYSLEEVVQILHYARHHRTVSEPLDFAFIAGQTNNAPKPTPDVIAAHEKEGVTWWFENLQNPDQAFKLARAGPPPR